MSSVFQPRRLTCQVPRMKAVIGMMAVYMFRVVSEEVLQRRDW